MLLDYVMIGGFGVAGLRNDRRTVMIGGLGVAGLRNDRRIWCCWIT